MKVAGSAKDILGSFAIAIKATERTSTLPIMEHLLLSEKDGDISVTGSDLERTVSVTVKGEIAVGESRCIPGRKIVDLLSRLGESEVTIETDDNGGWKVTSANTNINLAGLPGEDFPLPAINGETKRFAIGGDVLGMMIKHTLDASAKNDIRYYLNGLLFEFEKNSASLSVVGTDGHRLAVDKAGITITEDAADTSFILPRKTVTIIKDACPDVETLTFTHYVNGTSAGSVQIDLGNGMCIVSKVIDGKYPEWRRVIPEQSIAANVDASAMINAIDLVTVLADEGQHSMDMSLKDGSALLFTSYNNNAAKKTLPAETLKDVEVTFNGAYLRDALHAFEGATVEIHISHAVLFKHKSTDYPLHVVMPMKK